MKQLFFVVFQKECSVNKPFSKHHPLHVSTISGGQNSNSKTRKEWWQQACHQLEGFKSLRSWVRKSVCQYQFLCLCFVLAPAPYLFTKLEIPVVSLRRIGIWVTIYLSSSLFMVKQEEVIACQDTVIILLESLDKSEEICDYNK